MDKPEATATSQTADVPVPVNGELASKKKKKKKTTVNSDIFKKPDSETATNETVSSPGKFVKAPENPKQTSKSPVAQQKSNKRKFIGDEKPQNNAKKVKFNKNARKNDSSDISENRLKAFGINPKKFKNKLKYGGGRSNQNGQQKNRNNAKPFNKKKM
jgi:protein KRI1